MNGPQHYAEAERILAALAETTVETPDTPGGGIEAYLVSNQMSRAIAQAQAHATLALAAATIEEQVGMYTESDSSVLAAWGEAIS